MANVRWSIAPIDRESALQNSAVVCRVQMHQCVAGVSHGRGGGKLSCGAYMCTPTVLNTGRTFVLPIAAA